MLNRSLSEGIGDLTSLEDLNMSYCNSVASLPPSFCRLSNLKKLNLSAPGSPGSFMKLESLPERFGQLRSLVKLDLAGTDVEELPEGIPPRILPLSAALSILA